MNSYSINLNFRRLKNYSSMFYNYSDYYNTINPYRFFIFNMILSKQLNDIKNQFQINKNNLKENIKEVQENFKLYSQAVSLPHHKKIQKGGEDCHFISENIIVVTDGVGGWNQLGVDPAEYSRKICESIGNQFKSYEKIDNSTAKKMIIKANEEVTVEGSTTCCVLLYDDQSKRLYTSNIGDTSYIILRLKDDIYSLVFKSQEQLHSFNTPFQIGSMGDNPNLACDNHHDLEMDDIIIVATDGLWDNLDSKDILNMVNHYHKTNPNMLKDEKKLAQNLARKAQKLSLDKNYISPFSKRSRENNIYRSGGKPDDITVVVSRINYCRLNS